MTIQVPSAKRVTLSQLFAEPSRGLGVFGAAWRAQLRRQGHGRCVDFYSSVYETSATNYRWFALTPGGLAVGVREGGACGNLEAAVPYRILRPYLSKLGARLVAGGPPSTVEREASLGDPCGVVLCGKDDKGDEPRSAGRAGRGQL
jgi:hypothetical protein